MLWFFTFRTEVRELHYCMADVHGEYAMYMKMLEMIEFSASDMLYFIGDAADRGPRGVDIWKDIMARDNVVLIRGNHEQLCLDALYTDKASPDRVREWQQCGGMPTYQDLVFERSKEEREAILEFLASTPLSESAVVDGREYYFVHALPAKKDYDKLWGILKVRTKSPWRKKIVIVGHSPTIFLTQRNEPMRIWHGRGITDIDCGCGHNDMYSQLACLRLEDM